MSLSRCPDELLLAIFDHLPATDLAGPCAAVSRRFHRLANDAKIWHAHCCADYRYWNETDRALLDTAARTRTYGDDAHEWKKLWLRRKRNDRVCARHFEHVIETKVGRSRHMSAICNLQLDAKDFLQREYRRADQQAFDEFEDEPALKSEDCLARRYYANMAVSSINRSLAVEEWVRVRDDPDRFGRLDRALAAYDMFSIMDDETDMDGVERALDALALEFINDTQRTHGRFSVLSVREKASLLVLWLRARNLVGIAADPDVHYRDLRNCLIGQALTGGLPDHADHPSLPLVSSAIYASIGQRVGLSAYCNAVPGHVHATVLAPSGRTVDGRPRVAPTPPPNTDIKTSLQQLPDNGERIFFDPYRNTHEMPLAQLRSGMDSLAMGAVPPSVVTVDEVPPVADGKEDSSATPMDLDFDASKQVEVLPERPPPLQSRSALLSRRDTHLLPSPTVSLVLRLALNIDASWTHTMQNQPEVARHVRMLHRNGPDGPCISTSPYPTVDVDGDGPPLSPRADRRYRCGSHGDPHADMEKMTYASSWAMLLMRPTSDPEWEQFFDRLLTRFAHEYSEDAWILEKYLLPIHDQYIKDAVNRDPDGRHARGRPMPMPFGDATDRHRANAWTNLRNLLKLVQNLDARQPCVTRRYTQDIVESVHFRVGQVMRHKRYGFVGIIDGWAPNSADDLAGPATISTDEISGATPTTPTRMKPYYSVMRTGVERRVVSQHNIEIVTDPSLVPAELMFLAGKFFKRFDYATCTFTSNLAEFFPDD